MYLETEQAKTKGWYSVLSMFGGPVKFFSDAQGATHIAHENVI